MSSFQRESGGSVSEFLELRKICLFLCEHKASEKSTGRMLLIFSNPLQFRLNTHTYIQFYLERSGLFW